MRRVLERLHAAGLDSVPGGGAEILVDRVRRKIAKAKCTSDEWLGVMRVAHQMGLRSSAHDDVRHGRHARATASSHLVKIRDLQDETGGFTAFFCWDFQHERGTRIEPGDHGTHPLPAAAGGRAASSSTTSTTSAPRGSRRGRRSGRSRCASAPTTSAA